MQITSSSSTLGLVTALSFVLLLFSNPAVMAHTFSENENALFLTLISKTKAETQLVAHDAINNTQQAQIHAKAALGLLIQQDPVVNTTWTSQISELNPRVTADLIKSLNDLQNSVTTPASKSNSSSIQQKVANVNNLLDEAATVRISSNLLNNPKTQALVLANLANEIYNNYGKALGISQSTIASMGGMKTTGMNMNTATNSSSTSKGMSGMNMGNNKSSMNMGAGRSSSGAMSGMNSMSGQAAMNQNNSSIKNMTAYQSTQALASMAQQTFNKNFKPVAPSNTTSSTTTIGKYIDDLKNAVNNKSPFTGVMEIVHVKLHPTLITAYNLKLG